MLLAGYHIPIEGFLAAPEEDNLTGIKYLDKLVLSKEDFSKLAPREYVILDIYGSCLEEIWQTYQARGEILFEVQPGAPEGPFLIYGTRDGGKELGTIFACAGVKICCCCARNNSRKEMRSRSCWIRRVLPGFIAVTPAFLVRLGRGRIVISPSSLEKSSHLWYNQSEHKPFSMMPRISVKGVVKTMYHCHTCFYLVGCQQRAFDIIKEMPPLDRFSHEFLQSRRPEAALTAMADVIFADLQGADWKAELQTLSLHKKKGAELILLTEKSNAEALSNAKEVSDIWTTPMSDAEVRFRFLKWQQAWKSNKDFWLTRQYLETVINSVPNLIWYKTKDGIHVKVNDSFCAASGKTREQVEGQDHFHVWDVDPNDPEADGNSCMESERITMESKETCVTEETVKTGAGMRILTTYKSPLYDVDGSVMGTVGVGIDVTQERAYQQELMKQTQKVETIFTSLDCGILRYTVNGRRIIDVNEAALELLGYRSQEELEANTFDMIVSSIVDEDKEKVAEFLTQSETERGGSIGFCVRLKDGEIRTIMCDAEHSEENGELICQWFLLNFT